MPCPDCGCARPRCASGGTHPWRERAAWWTTAAFWRTIRAATRNTPHRRTHSMISAFRWTQDWARRHKGTT